MYSYITFSLRKRGGVIRGEYFLPLSLLALFGGTALTCSHGHIYGVSNMLLVVEDEQVCELFDLEVVDASSSNVRLPDDFLNHINRVM